MNDIGPFLLILGVVLLLLQFTRPERKPPFRVDSYRWDFRLPYFYFAHRPDRYPADRKPPWEVFECLECGNEMIVPIHTCVSKCDRCGSLYGIAGASLYVRRGGSGGSFGLDDHDNLDAAGRAWLTKNKQEA